VKVDQKIEEVEVKNPAVSSNMIIEEAEQKPTMVLSTTTYEESELEVKPAITLKAVESTSAVEATTSQISKVYPSMD
jgi:hypothetical protein